MNVGGYSSYRHPFVGVGLLELPPTCHVMDLHSLSHVQGQSMHWSLVKRANQTVLFKSGFQRRCRSIAQLANHKIEQLYWKNGRGPWTSNAGFCEVQIRSA